MARAARPPLTSQAARFRTFVVLWITQSLSLVGSGITLMAATLWATRQGGSRAELSATLAAFTASFTVSTLVFMPIAGAWADRHDRQRTMLSANIVCAAACAGTVLLLLAGVERLPLMAGFLALVAAAGAFHSAAFDASTVMVVPDRLLPRANGMMQTTWALRGILAPALAASLFALPAVGDGMALAIAIDGATFLLAAAALLVVRVPSPPRSGGGAGRSLFSDLLAGIRFIRHRPALLWLLGLFVAANLAMQPHQVLQPLFVRFDLAHDTAARGLSFEAGLAIVSTISSAGGVVGGVIVSAWGGLKRRRIRGVLVPMTLIGLLQVGFGLSSTVHLAAIFAFALFLFGPLLNAHSQALWQSETPPELQGRIAAVRRTLSFLVAPLSAGLAGWLGGLASPGLLLAILGGLLALFTAAQWRSPHRLRLGGGD